MAEIKKNIKLKICLAGDTGGKVEGKQRASEVEGKRKRGGEGTE